MTREQEIMIGEQIKVLAAAVCEAVQAPWNDIVFTVGLRKGEDGNPDRLTDLLYFRGDADEDYVNLYSNEGREALNIRGMRKITPACRKLREVSLQAKCDWRRFTVCIDSKGHFESAFEYASSLGGRDPFDKANMDNWEQRFLYGE